LFIKAKVFSETPENKRQREGPPDEQEKVKRGGAVFNLIIRKVPSSSTLSRMGEMLDVKWRRRPGWKKTGNRGGTKKIS